MKGPRGITLILVVATIVLAAPLVATSVACAEDGGTDCCGLDCATCLCCSHCSQITLNQPSRRSADEIDGRLQPQGRPTTREPLPRDILHVPRPAPVR